MVSGILAAIGGLILGLAIYHFRSQKMLLELGILKEKLSIQDKVHLEASEKLELRLKSLSQEIFEEKSKRFREDSLRGMELLLNPFKDKMTDFQRKVEEMHLTDTKDRIKLHSEIETNHSHRSKN